MNTASPWGPWPLDRETTRSWCHGQRVLWGRLEEGGLLLAQGAVEDLPGPPPLARWHLHPLGEGDASPGVWPALPERPVQVRCARVLHLEPGDSLALDLALPLLVQVRAGDKTLMECPLGTLRRTWVGSPWLGGELAYSHSPVDGAPQPGASCAVRVINRGEGVFQLDRILVPAPALAVYCIGDRLCCDALEISVGSDGLGETGVIGPADGALRLTGPRTAPGSGLLGRALVGLRDLPDVLRGLR
jgi:hypothetical protein